MREHAIGLLHRVCAEEDAREHHAHEGDRPRQRRAPPRNRRRIYPLNMVAHMAYSVAMQNYTADINIIPRQRLWDPRKLLSILSGAETLELIREGERATWPKVEMIRNCTLIARARWIGSVMGWSARSGRARRMCTKIGSIWKRIGRRIDPAAHARHLDRSTAVRRD